MLFRRVFRVFVAGTTWFLFSHIWLNAQIVQCTPCPQNISIPDAGCPSMTSSTLTVSGVGTIDNTFGLVQVCVYITHTWRADLQIELVAPDGTTVLLADDNGGSGDDFGAGCSVGQMLCFDMNAATSISSWTSTDPPDGTYQPLGCLGDVNNGQNADGIWTLNVCDDLGGIVGEILGWCLVFDNNPPTPSAGGFTPDQVVTAPFTGTGTTCGAGDNVTSNSCNSSYSTGEDVIYEVTFPSAGTWEIEVINTDASGWIAWFLTDSASITSVGCGAGGPYSINSCIGYATSSSSDTAKGCVNINSPGTYYLVIDYWSPPSCSGYQISIQPASSVSFTPDFSVTAPFSGSGTTCGAGNDITLNNCNTSYDGGEDIVYEVNFPSAGTYSISVVNTDGTGYIGWFLVDTASITGGCGGTGWEVSGCLAQSVSGAGDTATGCVNITSPGTYYLIIDYWPSPTCSGFQVDITPTTGGGYCINCPPNNDNCPNCTFISPGPGNLAGTTSASLTSDVPGNLGSEFCGTIENNQWFCFQATSSSMTFTFNVGNCTNANGAQFVVFDANVCGGVCDGFVDMGNNCINKCNPNSTCQLTATGLVPGKIYLLMVDGYAGDVCNFEIVGWDQGALSGAWISLNGRVVNGRAVLEWIPDVDAEVTGYVVERYLPSEGRFEKVKVLPPESRRWEELMRWSVVQYRVGALLADGSVGVYSNVILLTDEYVSDRNWASVSVLMKDGSIEGVSIVSYVTTKAVLKIYDLAGREVYVHGGLSLERGQSIFVDLRGRIRDDGVYLFVLDSQDKRYLPVISRAMLR